MAAKSNDFTPYKLLLMTLQQVGKIITLPLARSQLQVPDTSNEKLAAELLGHFHSPPSSPRGPAKCPFSAHFKTFAKPVVEENNKINNNTKGQEVTVKPPQPFAAMPRPKGLPVVGTLFDLMRSGAAPKIHMYCDKRHKELGPIYCETLGSLEAVFVSDAAIIKHVFASEGRYPHHLIPEPWTIYNESSGNERGLFFMNGPLWRARRRALNKVFLRRSAISDHVEDFVNITDDLMHRWTQMRDAKSLEVPDLERELYNWSIECLGDFIFGRRMGCVSSGVSPPVVDDEIHTFVQSVQQIFVESAKMTTVPPRLAYYLNLNVWKRFHSAVTSALTIARSLVENKIREIVVKAETGEPVDGLLAKLLLEDKIEEEELVRIVTDLFLAAADTTSHSTQWALHLLAKNPKCQQQLRQEIDDVIPKGEDITFDKLCRLPYARAIVKEALRLYPVAPFLTRILTDDVVLGGYKVPKGKLVLMSMYTTGRDAQYFEQPDQFLPERWLPGSTTTTTAPPHASLPFGSGTRSCIGRRIAETQMYLLLAQAVRHFDIESANEQEVDITLRMVTTPSEPIRLRLLEREN
uniref:Cytochrome P450 n=1 Tax=Strigamia maritima TaxID=126957 RepID=T1J337_STRMM